jgi:hypothetical protein
MTNRLTVGIEPGRDWSAIRRELLASGAESVREPRPEQPDVLIVTLASGADVDAFQKTASSVPGVRYAEPDTWQWTMSDPV